MLGQNQLNRCVRILLEKKKTWCVMVGTFQLDVLEYMHDQGFVHADIKAANLLLGFGKAAQNQVQQSDSHFCCHFAEKHVLGMTPRRVVIRNDDSI